MTTQEKVGGQTVVSQRGKIAFNDCTNNVFIVEV